MAEWSPLCRRPGQSRQFGTSSRWPFAGRSFHWLRSRLRLHSQGICDDEFGLLDLGGFDRLRCDAHLRGDIQLAMGLQRTGIPSRTRIRGCHGQDGSHSCIDPRRHCHWSFHLHAVSVSIGFGNMDNLIGHEDSDVWLTKLSPGGWPVDQEDSLPLSRSDSSSAVCIHIKPTSLQEIFPGFGLLLQVVECHAAAAVRFGILRL